MEPENLVKMVHQCGRPCISVPQVPEALDTALKIAGDECITLAAGSIFLAAETRQAWLERKSTKGSSK
jgi:folylpolyglutamate synthase/dihydropteroate synthase